MKDNKYFCEDLELEPKIMIKNLRQYILLENSYFLLLINISKKNTFNKKYILTLINPNLTYKKIVYFNGETENLFIY